LSLFLRYTTNGLPAHCPEVISPSAAHSFGILVIRHDVVVVRELVMADGASAVLLDDLSLQQLPHFCRRPQFPISPGVMRIIDTLHAGPHEPRLLADGLRATAKT
jgi:hypothetical protein